MKNKLGKLNLDKNYAFGVEMEFTEALQRDVGAAMRKNDKKYRKGCKLAPRDGRAARHRAVEYAKWQLTSDQSVTSNDDDGNVIGGEVISPTMDVNTQSFREIRAMIKMLTAADAVYTSDTGYHIHLDLGDVCRVVVTAIYLKLSHDILQMHPDRYGKYMLRSLINLNNTACSSDSRLQIAMLLMNNEPDYIIGEKYNDIHFYQENAKRFLEIRFGGMVDDHDLIVAWTKTCLQIVNEAMCYTDLFEFLTEEIEYDIMSLNDRAPRVLRFTTAERLAVENMIG